MTIGSSGMKGVFCRTVPVIAGLCLALFMIVGVVDLAAQQAATTVDLDKAYKFIGNWVQATEPRGNCGNFKDERGAQEIDCNIPVDQAPLNARAIAWKGFWDRHASSVLADCAAVTSPNLTGDGRPLNVTISQNQIIFQYEQQLVRRDIWMDGRVHPPPYELFYQGHAIAWFEGEDLIVDSANYTFDPDGLDDHISLPTSPRKHLVERYTLTDPDTMKITTTIDDPTFL